MIDDSFKLDQEFLERVDYAYLLFQNEDYEKAFSIYFESIEKIVFALQRAETNKFIDKSINWIAAELFDSKRLDDTGALENWLKRAYEITLEDCARIMDLCLNGICFCAPLCRFVNITILSGIYYILFRTMETGFDSASYRIILEVFTMQKSDYGNTYFLKCNYEPKKLIVMIKEYEMINKCEYISLSEQYIELINVYYFKMYPQYKKMIDKYNL